MGSSRYSNEILLYNFLLLDEIKLVYCNQILDPVADENCIVKFEDNVQLLFLLGSLLKGNSSWTPMLGVNRQLAEEDNLFDIPWKLFLCSSSFLPLNCNFPLGKSIYINLHSFQV